MQRAFRGGKLPPLGSPSSNAPSNLIFSRAAHSGRNKLELMADSRWGAEGGYYSQGPTTTTTTTDPRSRSPSAGPSTSYHRPSYSSYSKPSTTTGGGNPFKGEPRPVINIRASARSSYITDCVSNPAVERRPSSNLSNNSPLPLLILDLNGTLLNRQTKGVGGRGNVAEKSKRPIRRPFLANFFQYALGWDRDEAFREIQGGASSSAGAKGKGREGVEEVEGEVDETSGAFSREQLWHRWEAETQRRGHPLQKPHGSIFWKRPSTTDDDGVSASTSARPAWRSHPREPFASPKARYRLLVWSSAQSQNVHSMVKAILDPEHAAQLLRVWARETLVPSRRFRDKVGSLKDLEIAWGALNVESRGVQQRQEQDEEEHEGEKRIMADYRDETDRDEGNALTRGQEQQRRPPPPASISANGAKDKRRWRVRHREAALQQGASHLPFEDQGCSRDATPSAEESDDEKTASRLAADMAAAFVRLQEAPVAPLADVQDQGRKRKAHPSSSVSDSHEAPSPARGYGAHNTLLLDDSASKAAMQPFNHLLLPEFDDARASRVKELRHLRDEALLDLEDLYMERVEIEQLSRRRRKVGAKEAPGSDVRGEEGEGEGKRLEELEKEEKQLIREIEEAEAGIAATDDVLLQCVGILEHARRFEHVGRWIASGALGSFGGLRQVAAAAGVGAGAGDGTAAAAGMEDREHEEWVRSRRDPSDSPHPVDDDDDVELDLDMPHHRRDQRFWAREGRKALRIAGVRIDCE